ncbi:MAG: hypothetical protein QW472_02405 [Candidatus Aenigmatarchaeota archaeon]
MNKIIPISEAKIIYSERHNTHNREHIAKIITALIKNSTQLDDILYSFPTPLKSDILAKLKEIQLKIMIKTKSVDFKEHKKHMIKTFFEKEKFKPHALLLIKYLWYNCGPEKEIERRKKTLSVDNIKIAIKPRSDAHVDFKTEPLIKIRYNRKTKAILLNAISSSYDKEYTKRGYYKSHILGSCNIYNSEEVVFILLSYEVDRESKSFKEPRFRYSSLYSVAKGIYIIKSTFQIIPSKTKFFYSGKKLELEDHVSLKDLIKIIPPQKKEDKLSLRQVIKKYTNLALKKVAEKDI